MNIKRFLGIFLTAGPNYVNDIHLNLPIFKYLTALGYDSQSRLDSK